MKDRKKTKCLLQQQQQHMNGADGWWWILFVCFPVVKTANKLTTLIAKDQTSRVQVDGNILDPHESAI